MISSVISNKQAERQNVQRISRSWYISIHQDTPIGIHDTISNVEHIEDLLYTSLDRHNLHHHMAPIQVNVVRCKTSRVDTRFDIRHECFLSE